MPIECVGQVLDKLQSLGLAENTLVILSSDNGPVIDDGYRDDAVEKLGRASTFRPLRGGKYSKFEAGTRVPFLVRWPGKIQPGVSDALLSQVDLFATFAKLTGGKFPQDTAGDSQELSASLLGQSSQGRSSIVLQGIRHLALRRDQWKFIPGSQGAAKNPSTNSELGNHPQPQLYDLQKDIAESKNVAAEHPDVIASLQKELDAIQARPAYDQ
ncbi:MAG: sulfatase-like hydrolase/transferase [Pirellulales bacterium]